MKTLTVFTPSYNRLHTLVRTYESLQRQTCRDFEWLLIDDGSDDGTRDWVETLGTIVQNDGRGYDWMGRRLDQSSGSHIVVDVHGLRIEYVLKPNGGLYTGYNVAYDIIQTELCVCIDSDDYMPDDAVDNIVKCWIDRPRGKDYCGVLGLDYNVDDGKPIGGLFPADIKELFFHELRIRNIHTGDTKPVLRTDLMKKVAPMIGFEGEKNFNPVYMMLQVTDEYPILLTNRNFCWVEYQTGIDSMSQGIYRQYVNSANSFAKLRILEMRLKHNTLKDRLRSCVHYVASCIIAGDKDWLRKSPRKMLTLCAVPLGFAWYLVIKKNVGER